MLNVLTTSILGKIDIESVFTTSVISKTDVINTLFTTDVIVCKFFKYFFCFYNEPTITNLQKIY